MADKEQLAQVCKMAEIGLMTSSVLHEVRQPLFAIKSWAQMLQVDKRYEGDARVRQIVAAVESLEAMVGPLVDFARTARPETYPLDIHVPLKGALSLLSFKLRRPGIKVVESLAADLPMVSGEKQRFLQIFVNLLQNSLDATEGRPSRMLWITSRLAEGGDFVEVLVGDNGSGIEQSHLDQIFEYFFTTKPTGKGTGLGLAISADIARTHGGALDLVPPGEVGAGEGVVTVFRLRLPAVARAESGRDRSVLTSQY